MNQKNLKHSILKIYMKGNYTEKDIEINFGTPSSEK